MAAGRMAVCDHGDVMFTRHELAQYVADVRRLDTDTSVRAGTSLQTLLIALNGCHDRMWQLAIHIGDFSVLTGTSQCHGVVEWLLSG